MNSGYEDIIHLPRHISPTRPPMPIGDRAAQFSPFAALTGHSAAIKETARLTDQRIDLAEDARADIQQKLTWLEAAGCKDLSVAVTYFEQDAKKSGGRYITAAGLVKKIKQYEQVIILQDGATIAFDDLLDIQSEYFEQWE